MAVARPEYPKSPRESVESRLERAPAALGCCLETYLGRFGPILLDSRHSDSLYNRATSLTAGRRHAEVTDEMRRSVAADGAG